MDAIRVDVRTIIKSVMTANGEHHHPECHTQAIGDAVCFLPHLIRENDGRDFKRRNFVIVWFNPDKRCGVEQW